MLLAKNKSYKIVNFNVVILEHAMHNEIKIEIQLCTIL